MLGINFISPQLKSVIKEAESVGKTAYKSKKGRWLVTSKKLSSPAGEYKSKTNNIQIDVYNWFGKHKKSLEVKTIAYNDTFARHYEINDLTKGVSKKFSYNHNLKNDTLDNRYSKNNLLKGSCQFFERQYEKGELMTEHYFR